MIFNYLYFLILVIYYSIIVIKANNYNSLITSCNKKNNIMLSLVLLLGFFVAFRPLEISDAQAYYNRYYIEFSQTTIKCILEASSFYRGTGYSMSKPVNLLFYIFRFFHIPYQGLVFFVVIVEVGVYYVYAKKIFNELKIEYNEYLFFAMLLLFYCFRYQFIAFAQGMSMCFATPILYLMIKRKYIKTAFFIALSCSIHIAALFFVVIAIIYLCTFRIDKRAYIFLWGISGLFLFSGLGFKLGERVAGLAQFMINRIVSSNPVYIGYGTGGGDFVLSISNSLFWLLCGLFTMVYSEYEDYWRLLNINIVTILITSVFGRWEIIHRFTDISKMYVPILMIIYIYKSKSVINIFGWKNKLTLSVLVLGFVHSLSLIGFL